MKTNAKRISLRLIALIIATVMTVSVIPVTVLAAEESQEQDEYVYLSVSFNGKYITDKHGAPMVYLPIAMSDIAAVDLCAYGLEDLLFDGDGDGEYDTTALQLLIYAHEELYGGSWEEVDFDAIPGSSYFKDGIFGFTENLVYFLNGDFPVDESQQSDYMTVGATSDRIVLHGGDFLDVASFSCYSFLWDQAGGFHLFADGQGSYVHDYSAEVGETLPVYLLHSFCDLMVGEAWVTEASDYEIFYGTAFDEPLGSVTTDGAGYAELAFEASGVYYLWCDGANSEDYGTHGSCDYCLETGEPCIVSAPAYARVTVSGSTERLPQSVSDVLGATMAQLAATVSSPSFGTIAGEWTVFALARGGYLAKDSAYFTEYYSRIVDTVNATAEGIGLNGALDKSKSTENSRLIVALSAIGKDAREVGEWDLVQAYSANGIHWIKKQGMNGTVWALIALDSNGYATKDDTLRQTCVDSILSLQHDDGGWSLTTNLALTSNVDVTAMALTALYPYRSQPAVAAACERAIAWLSLAQLPSGGFPYGSGETSESCAWAIVALTTWGINPDTDPRFIKNGNSAVDNLLSYYNAQDAMFAHQGSASNAMATDQACYALVAYQRLLDGKSGLFDYSDVAFDELTPPTEDRVSASLSLPSQIESTEGATFIGTVLLDGWSNDTGYRLLDLTVEVPRGLSVADVSAGGRLSGGTLSYHLSEGKLRIVYFDASTGLPLTVSGALTSTLTLFRITFCVQNATADEVLTVSLSELSLKSGSDPGEQGAGTNADVSGAEASVTVVQGVCFSASRLYEGDGVDLIPTGQAAILVTVTGRDGRGNLVFRSGDVSFLLRYSENFSQKLGSSAYLALVPAELPLSDLEDAGCYTDEEDPTAALTLGDVNADGIVNAQDALAVVNMWLRKAPEPDDGEILAANVNGDSRIDTYDVLGIVDAFISAEHEHAILNKSEIAEE